MDLDDCDVGHINNQFECERQTRSRRLSSKSVLDVADDMIVRQDDDQAIVDTLSPPPSDDDDELVPPPPPAMRNHQELRNEHWRDQRNAGKRELWRARATHINNGFLPAGFSQLPMGLDDTEGLVRDSLQKHFADVSSLLRATLRRESTKKNIVRRDGENANRHDCVDMSVRFPESVRVGNMFLIKFFVPDPFFCLHVWHC